MPKQDIDFAAIALRLGKVFKPSAPIKKENLFHGRTNQIREVIDAINQPGKHVVLYGEGGVGKTSLGQILQTKLRAIEEVPIISPLINCDSGDDFTSIWNKMFEEIADEYKQFFSSPLANADEPEAEPGPDGHNGPVVIVESAGGGPKISPRDVRKQLEPLAKAGIVYVILDEFDKVKNPDVRRLMADTIKLFSDREVQVTIILIGVAKSVTGLIDDHHSIERCLAQVHMPRMPFKELVAIVEAGLKEVGMTIKTEAIEEIAGLSRGLPHYTHLLALNSGRCALDERKLEVAINHVSSALKSSMAQTDESIRNKYELATFSTKKNTLHSHVLLACALAECDDHGYFQPGNVAESLSALRGEKFNTDRFSSHLKKWCDLEVLYRDGREYHWRYHFANPLMQPYVIMKGLVMGIITRDQLNFAQEKYPLFKRTT